MARSATIKATTTMPAKPAAVHVAGSASTSTLPATQARSAAKITRTQALGRSRREATQAQSAPKAITPRPRSSQHDGEVEARHLHGGMGGGLGERSGEDCQHGARDDGEDGVAPQGAAQQTVG